MEVFLATTAIIVAFAALLGEAGHQRRMDRLQEDLSELGGRLARLERSTRPLSMPEAQESPEPDVPPLSAAPLWNEPSPPESVPLDASVTFDKDWWTRLEKAVGIRWTTWVGAVVLILGAGLFVKYAFDHRWLGPAARVILGVVVGLALMATGERFIRRQMRTLGQGLVGTGLAALYISLYAVYGFYDLLPQLIVFGLMVAVTAGGMALAIAHDAMTIAILAILGGFLTPVMLSTGRDSRDALFAYILLLDLGVLALAVFKRWRALDVLAFAGTSLLFAGWYIQFRCAPSFGLTPTITWLAAFYLVFLVGPVLYPLRAATVITDERFLIAVANAVSMFGWSYTLLYPGHRPVLGIVTTGMAAAYLVLAILTRRRIREDPRAVLGFMAMSLTLAIVTIPILLDMEAVRQG